MSTTGTSATRIRCTLLLAEDYLLVATGVVQALTARFDVIEITRDGETLIDRAYRLQPDGVVVDVGGERMDYLAATIALRQRFPSMPIVLVTSDADAAVRREAVAIGASAVVLVTDVVDTMMRLFT